MAGKKIGLVLALDNEKEFTQAVTNAKKEVQLFKTGLEQLSKEFDGNANSMEFLKQKQELLTKQQEAYQKKLDAARTGLENATKTYNKQADKLEELRKRLKEAEAAQEQMKKTGQEDTDAYKKQSQEVENLSEAVKKQSTNVLTAQGRVTDWNKRVLESEADLKKNNAALNKNSQYLDEARNSADECAISIDRFGEEAAEAAEEMDAASEKTSTFGDMLKANLTANAIIEGVKKIGGAAKEAAEYAVDVGSSFEAAMSEVAAISGATGDQLSQMEAKAKELGSSTKFSATEAADAFKYMSLAGWSTSDMLSGIDGVMQLAAASGMELAQASDMVTDYLSAFGMTANESAHFADMLAYAQANSNTTAEALGEAYRNCAANLNAAGQDVETTTSLLEAMANQGYKGSEAGTALTAMMRDITKAMKNGEIAIGDTTVKVTDAKGNYRDLTEILKDVEAATSGMGDAERATALSSTFTADSTKGLNLILNEGVGRVEKYEDALRNCDGAAAGMASTMSDNLKGDITEAGSALEGLGIAAYEYVEGPLRGVVQGVTEVIAGITKEISPQKTEMETFVDDIKKSNDEVTALLESAQKTVSGAEVDVSGLESYKKILVELNEVENKTEFQKFQVKSAVDALSGSIPELAAAFNEETGKINLTSEAITKLIGNQENLIKQQAYAKASQEAYEALATAQLNQAKAQNALEQAQKARSDYLEEDAKRAENIANGIMSLKVTQEISDLNNAVNTAQVELDKANKSVDETNDLIDTTEGALRRLADTTDEGTSATDANAAVQEKLATRNQETAKTAKDAMEAISEQSEVMSESAQLAEKAAQAISDAYDGAFKSVKDAYDSAKQELKNGLSIDFTADEFDGGIDLSVEKMLENSKTQLEGLRNYEKNLAEVRDHVGKEIAPEFMEYLEGLGTDGAKMLEHISKTFEQDNGAELVTQWSDNYLEQLDIQDRVSTTLANDALVLRAGLEDMGSSDIEWSGLEQAFEEAQKLAQDGGSKISQATLDAFQEAAGAAQQTGVEIPKGLADGLSSGEISIENATDQLNAALRGSFDGLAEIAREQGIAGVEELAAGIENGSRSVESAYNDLIGLIAGQAAQARTAGEETGKETASGAQSSIKDGAAAVEQASSAMASSAAKAADSKQGEFQTAGENAANAFATGIGNGSQSAMERTRQMVAQALSVAQVYQGSFNNVGYNMSAGMAQGMIQGAPVVTNAARSVVAQAKAAAQKEADVHSPSRVWRNEIGMNLTKGMAMGMLDGRKDVMTAAREMAAAALSASQTALDIHSPSGVFKKAVGKQIGAGMAFGIKDSASLAGKEAKRMSNTVYTSATKWLSKYKKSHKVSLEDEKYYWTQVSKHVKNGTDTYKKAIDKLADVLQNQTPGLGDSLAIGMSKQLSKNFGVSRYTKTTTGSGKNKKTVTKKKGNEDYYGELYSAAQKYLANYQVLHDVSLEEEKAYWTQIKKQLKKGTQGWYDTQKNINALNEKIKAEKSAANEAILSDAEDYIKKRQILGKMNERQELDYLKKTQKQLKKGSDAWYDAQERINELQKSIAASKAAKYDDMVSDAEDYIRKRQILGEMSEEQELSYWENIIGSVEKGTDAWYDAQEHINELRESVASAREEANNAIVSDTEDYIRKQKILNNMSEQEELAYWESVIGTIEMGTDAWYDAYEIIKELRQSITDEAAQAAEDANSAQEQFYQRQMSGIESALSKYKTYRKVSLVGEMQYWAYARSFFQNAGDERIEADQKYYEATQAYYDELEKLNEEYAENSKEINDKLIDNVKELEDAYKDAVKSRKNDILSQMDLFEAWDSTGYDADTLLRNLETQVSGLALWEQQLEELGRKTLPEELMEELREMGPNAAASIYSLNHMTAGQLDEYVKMWRQKNALAESQAVKENEQLRLDTINEISQLRLDAQSELEALYVDYRASVEELGTDMYEDMKALVKTAANGGEEAVNALMAELEKGASPAAWVPVSQKIEAAMSAQLTSGMRQAGQVIGKSTLDSIISAMTDQGEISEAAQSVGQSLTMGIIAGMRGEDVITDSGQVVERILGSVREAADIHSPSRLFRDQVGKQMAAGISAGMLDEAGASSRNMIKKMLSVTQEEMRRRQESLQAQAAALDYSGILRINDTLSAYKPPEPVVKVDNSTTLAVMEGIMGRMEAIADRMTNLGIYLNGDTLVGELSEPVGNRLAYGSVRKRGRL